MEMDIILDTAEGEWFDYFESHVDQGTNDIIYQDPIPNGPRVQIRNSAPFIEEALKKREQVVDRVFNPKTRAMDRIVHLKDISIAEMIAQNDDEYDYAITGIEGFKNKKTGEIVACTQGNKAALRRNEMFSRFYDRCQKILRGEKADQAKAAEKN